MADSRAVTKKPLRFFLSARDLPMRDRGIAGATLQDPYIRWLAKDNHPGRKEFRLEGTTTHKINNPNPEYFEVSFPYDWEKGMGHKWRFEVMDFDALNKDDVMGHTEVDVDEYVSKGQGLYQKLSGVPQGALLIKKCEVVTFKLSAQNLPALDAFQGKSDPYVECFWSAGKGAPLHLFHKTKVIENAENCEWDEVIEFPVYQAGENQLWVFKLWDKDPLPKDDCLGESEVNIDDYVKGKKTASLRVSKDTKDAARLIVTPTEKAGIM